jgi:hypothetical protein
VVDPVPDSVLKIDLFEDIGLDLGQIDVPALESVVDFFSNIEKIRPTNSAFIPAPFINSVMLVSTSATPPP